MSTKLDRIANKARTDTKLRFTALAHVVDQEFLVETWGQMNHKAASGVDGETTTEFAANLEERCADLWARLKARQYKAPPVRRTEIPKGRGKTRRLGIPTVEDRLLQKAVARILSAIYEPVFLDCSYGYRPKRNPHQALKTLRDTVMARNVQWVFETDIRGFFNHLSHKWLMQMLELRIGDPVVLRWVGKWLRAGVLDNGVLVKSDEGAPQGGPISPILANIYLHYALDLWFEKCVVPRCRGEAYLIRFVDDFIALFRHKRDAERFEGVVRKRLAKFGLELAEEKTRLFRFGRNAARSNSEDEAEAFEFLGFRHTMGKDRKGRFAVIRRPSTKSCRKFLDRVRQWLRRNQHIRCTDQRRHLRRMLTGFYQYFGLSGCSKKLGLICHYVYRIWARVLQRQSQRSKHNWDRLWKRPWFRLPNPKLTQPNV